MRGSSVGHLLAIAGIVSSLGCAVGRVRSYPLYPHAEQPRSQEDLARIEGPIQFIDAINVDALGTVFDVLPGCHVVILRRTIGEMSYNGGAWWADLGGFAYAFRTKAGRTYSIEYATSFGSAGHGTGRLAAYERDLVGRMLSAIPLVRSEHDVVACREWEAAQKSRADSSVR